MALTSTVSKTMPGDRTWVIVGGSVLRLHSCEGLTYAGPVLDAFKLNENEKVYLGDDPARHPLDPLVHVLSRGGDGGRGLQGTQDGGQGGEECVQGTQGGGRGGGRNVCVGNRGWGVGGYGGRGAAHKHIHSLGGGGTERTQLEFLSEEIDLKYFKY